MKVPMNQEWQEKLVSVGASVTNNTINADNQIDKQAQQTLPLLVDLSPLAIVDITGEDAATFLQAQVCNDLTALSANEAQINGYCSPKGRLLALFTAYAIEGGYRLILPADVCPAFTKRLQMFVMRAVVNINVRTDLVCTGLVFDSGKAAVPPELTQHIAELPDSVMHLYNNHNGADSVHVMRWQDSNEQARFLLVGLQDDLLPLWKDPQFTQTSWSYWRWGDINAGMPSVHAQSTEQFIPQMLNMQLINALSFKKGCYPGQEIVARMQYLGKLKKHMKHLCAPGLTGAVVPGEVLITETNNNAGQVVDAIVDEHGVNLLAVVNIETPVSDLMLAGTVLQEAALPYSIANESDKSA